MARDLTSAEVHKQVDDECEQLQIALKKLKMSAENACPVKQVDALCVTLKHKHENQEEYLEKEDKEDSSHHLQRLHHGDIRSNGNKDASKSVCENSLCRCSVCRVSQSRTGTMTKALSVRKPLLREARLKFLAEVPGKHTASATRPRPSVKGQSIPPTKNKKSEPSLGHSLSCPIPLHQIPPQRCPVTSQNSHFSFTGTPHLVDSFSTLNLSVSESQSELHFRGSYRDTDARLPSSQTLRVHSAVSALASQVSNSTAAGATCVSRQDLPIERSCSQEARLDEMSVNELAAYFDDFIYIPKKMSSMAEMMYT